MNEWNHNKQLIHQEGKLYCEILRRSIFMWKWPLQNNHLLATKTVCSSVLHSKFSLQRRWGLRNAAGSRGARGSRAQQSICYRTFPLIKQGAASKRFFNFQTKVGFNSKEKAACFTLEQAPCQQRIHKTSTSTIWVPALSYQKTAWISTSTLFIHITLAMLM